MRKRRILMTNEYSGLATGYSVYGKELLGRLRDHYEVAELACGVQSSDPRLEDSPWKIYGNAPADRRLLKEFESSPSNGYGEYSFNRVCLEFRPDVVIDIRDPWMYAFIERSPLRRHFHWIQMPTVDSVPQDEQWLATLMGCDRVLTYTSWGREVLRKEGGGLIDVFGVASPGADLDAFKDYGRDWARKHFNIDDESFIVGTVMRNQTRKLYPQLIDDFAEYIATSDKALASKTYLYLHVSYPDVGWDIPRLIKQSGVSHRILVTYKCRDCLFVFPSLYADGSRLCPHCKSRKCTMPNMSSGVDRATLSQLMSTFDVYVQYASCEGFGMPMVEAAMSGVPIMATDYSAMESVVRDVGGYPLKVGWMELDPYIEQYRARPDPQDFIKTLRHYARMGRRTLEDMRRKARRLAEQAYTWDKAADVWRQAIESLPLRPWGQTWESPSLPQKPARDVPKIESNTKAVRWAVENVMCRPDLVDSYMALRMTRDLNWGQRIGGQHQLYQNEESVLGVPHVLVPYSRQDMINELRRACEVYNKWEAARVNHVFKEK